jgi:hypothetical protein
MTVTNRSPFHFITDRFQNVPVPEQTPEMTEKLKADKEAGVITTEHPTDIDADNVPDAEFQRGVQQIEAITSVWSKRDLIAAYVLYVLHLICQV